MFARLAPMLRGLSGEVELGRVLWGVAVLAHVTYQGIAIFVLRQAFSPVEFGTGVAAVLAAGGLGVAAKDTGVARAKAKGAQSEIE
jgi:hypothetical protein